MKEFKDRVAVVTGAASGIGRGMVENFVDALKLIGIVLAAGFIGYFGRYLAMAIIDKFRKKKPLSPPAYESSPETPSSLELQLVPARRSRVMLFLREPLLHPLWVTRLILSSTGVPDTPLAPNRQRQNGTCPTPQRREARAGCWRAG